MLERLKRIVLKTIVPATVPWVRIPLSPPYVKVQVLARSPVRKLVILEE